MKVKTLEIIHEALKEHKVKAEDAADYWLKKREETYDPNTYLYDAEHARLYEKARVEAMDAAEALIDFEEHYW